MTGFGRAGFSSDSLEIQVELRSVNSRFLDVIFRNPGLYPSLEASMNRTIRKRVQRGRVEVTIFRKDKREQAFDLNFNKGLFSAYLQVVEEAFEIARVSGKSERAVAVTELLKRREILDLESHERESSEDGKVLEKVLEQALDELLRMRHVEGQSLEKELRGLLADLRAKVAKLRETAESAPEVLRQKLQDRIAQVDIPIDPERLAQEAVIYADKCDVTEELTRLESHFSQFETFLAGQGTGRKLEFLLQEIGREINTTGSKLQQAAPLVVDAKGILEKMREQTANIE